MSLPEALIRAETAADVSAVRTVTQRAFAGDPHAGGNEHQIVDALRDGKALALSLVAERDSAIVGHVAFSPAEPADGSPGWYTLGPVSVEPPFQRQGIGRALIMTGIRFLREGGAAGCIVVGDPGYYSRFGFVQAPDHAPADELKEYYMTLTFGPAVPAGVIDFHRAFYEP